MSKAIMEKHDEEHRWGPGVETAPSVVRADEPTIARFIGLFGAVLVVFGGIALLFNLLGRTERVGIGWSSLYLALGTVGMLAHAAYDSDLQMRRLYWGLGVALLALGLLLAVIPFEGDPGT